MPHSTAGERVLASLLFGVWPVMTLTYVLLPPELRESRAANIAIGAVVLGVVVAGVVWISRRQRRAVTRRSSIIG